MSDLLTRLRKRTSVRPVRPPAEILDSNVRPPVRPGVRLDDIHSGERVGGAHEGAREGATETAWKPPQDAQGAQGARGTAPEERVGAQPQRDPRTRPAPRPDAPDWQWDQYFAQEQRIIREGGRAEVETFGTMVPKSQLMNHSSRTRREVAEYLREFRPGPDTPDDPCQCGDTVFYKLGKHSHWRCRSCERLNPNLNVRWFVLPRTIGDLS